MSVSPSLGASALSKDADLRTVVREKFESQKLMSQAATSERHVYLASVSSSGEGSNANSDERGTALSFETFSGRYDTECVT